MSEQTLKDLMVTDVLIVHLADSMQDVFPKITEQPDRFVVVLDHEDVPDRLTTGSEMRSKMPRSLQWPNVEDLADRLPEALLADENAAIDQTMVFFGIVSQGLVVMRGAKVAGVLPYKELETFYNEKIVPRLRAEVKTIRSGQPVIVASAEFVCRRHPRCDFTITADLVDKPPLCGTQASHGRTRLKA